MKKLDGSGECHLINTKNIFLSKPLFSFFKQVRMLFEHKMYLRSSNHLQECALKFRYKKILYSFYLKVLILIPGGALCLFL